MQVQITNLTASPVLLQELYTTLAANATITISRSPADLAESRGLQAALAAGTVSVVVTPTATELAAGLLVPPQSITANDAAPVAAADMDAAVFTKRFTVTGTGLSKQLHAVGAVPYKFRILDAAFFCSTASGATTLVLQETAGGNNIGLSFDTGTTGRKSAVGTTTGLVTAAANRGLFATSTVSTIVGELVLTCRRES